MNEPLPESKLLSRSDQPWEQEINEKRVRAAMNWLVYKLADFETAVRLGMDPESDDALLMLEGIWHGTEARLTRRELVSAFITLATPSAHELADVHEERRERDWKFLHKVNWLNVPQS